MYTFSSRVRYSETDPEGFLTITALINYLQDCSTFQSEDLGIGIGYLQQQHAAWLLNYWQIDVKSLPRLGDEIVIGTSPYGMKGFLGYRNFMIDSPDGFRYVEASSVWSLMNMQKMLPMRVPPLMYEKYTIYPKFDMEYTSRKIAVPSSGGMEGHSVIVAETMLDSNRHVNNAQYVNLAVACFPEAEQTSLWELVRGRDSAGSEGAFLRLRVEYENQAHLGDRITPVYYGDENDRVIALNAAEGKPYAVVELVRCGLSQEKAESRPDTEAGTAARGVRENA